jgi:Ca-activated chloride channel family protein
MEQLSRTRAGTPADWPLRATALLLLLSGILLPASLHALERDNTLLILDASGSMWGRVEGRSKIETARDVLVDLLAERPLQQSLGLMSYGHRRKGDCADIELLVPPAVQTGDDIRRAVTSIKPRGKTPLSSSVIEAARVLRSEQNKATVILVSDGRETCGYDPCQVARELEASGVEFTAHVIGFNVTDPIDLSQLQCMAENTGGQFVAVSNGTELSDALQSVSDIFNPHQTAQPDGIGQHSDRELANLGANSDANTGSGQSAGAGLETSIDDTGRTNTTTPTISAATGVAEALAGDAGDASSGSAGGATANGAGNDVLDSTLAVDAESVKRLYATQDIDIELLALQSRANRRGTTEDVQPRNNRRDDRAGSEIGSGATNEIRLPAAADVVEVPAALPPVPSSSVSAIVNAVSALSAPATLYTQQVFTARWKGNGRSEDLIVISEPGSSAESWLQAEPVGSAIKMKLTAPAEPGEYEVRYVSAAMKIMATTTITVRKAEATLLAPQEARGGRLVRIRWKGGTKDPKDSIVITRKDAPLSSAINRRFIRTQSSVMLLMPSRAGEYELRYMQAGGNALATKPIEVR